MVTSRRTSVAASTHTWTAATSAARPLPPSPTSAGSWPGLRHVAPPRDLGARVRAGVESASIPWWRKPTTIFTAVGGTLAAVTGALLALVVLNGTTNEPNVGQVSPTATVVATPGESQSPPPAATAPPVTTLPAPAAARRDPSRDAEPERHAEPGSALVARA